MMRLETGWFKIYLFYGLIFFLLGAGGFLANHDQQWADWSKYQMNRLRISFARKESSIPVFGKQLPEVNLFCRIQDHTNLPNINWQQQIENRLQSRFRKIIITSIKDSGQLDALIQYNQQTVPWLFMTVEITETKSNQINYCLSFSTSSDVLAEITVDVVQRIIKKTTSFTIHKTKLHLVELIELNWQVEGPFNPNQPKLLTDLIEIICHDFLEKKVSHPTLD